MQMSTGAALRDALKGSPAPFSCPVLFFANVLVLAFGYINRLISKTGLQNSVANESDCLVPRGLKTMAVLIND